MASIRSKGPYQWQVQIRRKGWPVQTATFRTKKHGQEWARKIEREMDQGLLVDQSAGRETSFKELIELYLEHVTDNRPQEYSRITERIKLNMIMRKEKALCAYAVTNLTPEHFEDYRDRRRKQLCPKKRTLLKPNTINKELNLMKRVIDYRMRRLGVVVNPVNTRDVKRLPENDERNVRLSAEERQRLYEACRQMRNKLLLPFVELGFETGARRGNLLRLEWADLTLPKATALLRAVKNSRNPDKIIDQTIGLTPRAVEILESLPRTEERVFPMSANAFRLAFNRAREKAGLEHFRFHDTRHERVSSLFEAGWSMVQVMAQSGHRDPKSVKRYANISGEHLAGELAKL